MSKIRPYTKEEADMFIGEVAKSKHDGNDIYERQQTINFE